MNVKIILSGLLAATMMSACSSSDQKPKISASGFSQPDSNTAKLNALNAITPAMYDETEKADFAQQLTDLAPRVALSSFPAKNQKSVCWVRDIGSSVKKGDTLFFNMSKTTFLRTGKLIVEYVLTKTSPELVDDTGRAISSSSSQEITLGCSSEGSTLTFADVSKALNGALTFVSGK